MEETNISVNKKCWFLLFIIQLIPAIRKYCRLRRCILACTVKIFVLIGNDVVAAAILHEALRQGKAVPADLQIIGYDDIPLSRLLFPPLSTIKQPAYEMGREAAKLLIRLINDEKGFEKNIQLPVAFIERQTTRKVEEHG